jgi:uncharacterized Zn finger protein
MGYWDWYPRSKPRRPAKGIRAKTGRGRFGKSWWAGKWIAALERLVDPGRLSRGRSYARSGQVLNIDIQPGRVDSRVQGSRLKPYQVRIKIEPLSNRAWTRVTEAMASQAIFAAKLLSGEMPQNIEEAFRKAKVSLFPAKSGDLETNCSCPDYANPCKHIAAVYYLLGEQFDADPFLIFRLRGKSKNDIMALLRTRRSSPEPVAAKSRRKRDAQAKPEETEPAVPLETGLDRFWDLASNLNEFQAVIEVPQVDGAPVKRLGSPGFWRNNKVDFIGALTHAYQSVTQASLDVALGDGEK